MLKSNNGLNVLLNMFFELRHNKQGVFKKV